MPHSPLAERASHEWSSSADRPPALLASSPDPSRICAPAGSAPPAEESENTVNTQVLALKMAEDFNIFMTAIILLRGPRGGSALVWCPALSWPSSAAASACGIDP